MIEKADFAPDTPLCTEKSLSDRYGVSRVTAGRAIKELEMSGILYRKRGVGTFVRLDEQVAARPIDLGPAANENGQESKVFALVVPFPITQGGFLRSVSATTNKLANHNHHLTIQICEPDESAERRTLAQLVKQDVDGIVFYPNMMSTHEDIFHEYVDRGKPVIILDKPHDYENLSCIVCDNYTGSYQLTKHLVDYGHRRIAYLSRFDTTQRNSIRDRYNGFSDCMRDEAIRVDEGCVKMNLSSEHQLLKHVVNQLHKAGVTAIMCENDEFAFYILMCCRSLSIHVPSRMSVVGFDNSSWSTTGNAQLTTVDQNFELIGEQIAELFLDTEYESRHIVIPAELIPRDSSGPVRQG